MNKINSWTPLFTSIMKFLHLGAKIIKPNAKLLRVFTGLRVDKIISSRPHEIKYQKVNSSKLYKTTKSEDSIDPFNLTNLNNLTDLTNLISSINPIKTFNSIDNIGEWIWNTNKIPNRKSHTNYIFYIHGGAFCAGNTYNTRGFLYQLAERTNSVIFSSNYRKAPEFKYPIPITDCIAGYEYFRTKIKNHNLNPTIIVMGDSAGGNLSINLVAHLIKTNQPMPSGCILISPWVNLADNGNNPSWVDNSAYDYVKYDLAKFFAHEYINQNTTNLQDISPSYLSDDILSKFPPTLIEYGDYETLRDQITLFAIKLEKLGTNVTYNLRYEMTHNYPLFYFTKIPQAEDFFISVKKFIKKIGKKSH